MVNRDDRVKLPRELYSLLGEQLKVAQEQLELVEQLQADKKTKYSKSARLIAEDLMENYYKLDELADQIAKQLEGSR